MSTMSNALPLPPTWVDEAACTYHDPELFFPDHGTPLKQVALVKRICRECPVRLECLEFAATLTPRPVGIWGGLNTNERELIHPRRPRAKAREAR